MMESEETSLGLDNDNTQEIMFEAQLNVTVNGNMEVWLYCFSHLH